MVLGAFLALVGVQAAHSHDDGPSLDSCAVCALAHQAQGEAPHAAPAVAASVAWESVFCAADRFASAPVVLSGKARAPPALS